MARAYGTRLFIVTSSIVMVVLLSQGHCSSNECPPPKLTNAPESNGQLFRVLVAGRVGYIDCEGHLRIPTKFAYGADRFSEGLAVIADDTNRHGFIDATGRVVITPAFEQAHNFREGLAAAKVNGKWGFIERAGTWSIRPQYDAVEDFRNGFARVGNATTASRIRNRVSDVELSIAWKLIDRSGQESVDSIIGQSLGDTQQLVPKAVADKWGYTDRRQQWVITPRYDGAGEFHEGFAPVAIRGKWSCITVLGTPIADFQFDWAYGFQDGLCGVAVDGKFGYINSRGRVVWTPTR